MTNQSQAVAVSGEDLSDERINRFLSDLDYFCKLPLYDASFAARAREKVRAILSEGTASLKAENERLRELVRDREQMHQDLKAIAESGDLLRRMAEEERDSLRTQLAEAQKEIERLRQGLWDTYAALGCDTDGDATPKALVSDIVPLVVNAAKEVNADYLAALTPKETQ